MEEIKYLEEQIVEKDKEIDNLKDEIRDMRDNLKEIQYYLNNALNI